MKHTMKLALALLLAVLLTMPTFVLAENDSIAPEAADVAEAIEVMEAEADVLAEADADGEPMDVPEAMLLEEEVLDETEDATLDDGAVSGDVQAEADVAGTEELTVDLSEALGEPAEAPAEDAAIDEDAFPADGEAIDDDEGEGIAPADGADAAPGEGEQDAPADGADELPEDGADAAPSDGADELPADGADAAPADGESSESAETPEAEADGESAGSPMAAVRFEGTPEAAEIAVWSAAADGDPSPIPAQPEGGYLLPPGDYIYSAEADGYVPARGVPFTVPEGGEALTVAYALEEAPVVPRARVGRGVARDTGSPALNYYGPVNEQILSSDSYTEVTFETVEWSDGWYAATGNVRISRQITVSGSANLILRDGATLTTTNGIELQYGASLTVWAESAAGTGKLDAVFSGDQGNLVIEGGEITANGAYAIQCQDIAVYGGKLTATGGDGIMARSVTIGEKAEAVTASGGSYGIDASANVDIRGGTVVAKATNTGEVSYGICAGGSVIIGEKAVKVTASGWYRGIHTSDGVTIQGGTVEATGTGDYGIYAYSVTIGENAKKVTASGGSFGIEALRVTIQGGEVVATSTGESEARYGIYADYSVTIGENAKKVTATGGSYGIWAGDNVAIQGGKVEATGTSTSGASDDDYAGTGIYAKTGNVTIGPKIAKVAATGGVTAIHVVAGQFQLFDRAKVTAGGSESTATPVAYTPDPDSRAEACRGSKYARIEPCDHPGEGTCEITKDTHTIHCAYCAVPTSDAVPHSFGENGEGECVCGAWNVMYLDPETGAMQGPVFCLPAGVSMSEGSVSEGWYASGRSASFEDRIQIDGEVNLILCDGATLEAKQGVDVGWGDKLIVWAQSDGSRMGALNADGGSEAGIGNNNRSGDITINGGAVTGTSSGNWAGIGGSFSNITINGGRVTGECTGGYGAGIGDVGKITINGGVVRGTATDRGAGIGGSNAASCDITITGGTVTGTSLLRGAGIGGGAECGTSLTIDISGGTVTGESKQSGAGIGGGFNGKGGTVNISGGAVTGIGSSDGSAGIGSGAYAPSDGTVTLDWSAETCEGMSVTATGYSGAVTMKHPFKHKADESETYSGDIANLAALAGKTLVPNVIPPESIALEPATAKLLVGDTLALTATSQPEGSYAELKWTSSDESVATVDADGTVTARGAGKATITATTQNGKTATCEVTVYTAPTGIAVSPASAKLLVGKTKALTATVQGENADPTVTWKSSNTKVATVSSAGKVTAKAAGKATITATTVNGLTAKCTVTVYNAPTGVTVTPTKKTLKKGGTVKLKATVKGKNAYPTVTWTSSNSKVAKVSKKGVVTALKPGKATITVKTVNGKKAKCVITVTSSAAGMIKFD